MTVARRLDSWTSAAADLLWPTSCPGCGRPGNWCADCRPDVALCARVVLLPDQTPVAAAAEYGGTIAAAIRAWKLGGRRRLLDPLADHLAEAVMHLLVPPGPLVLVPVPVRPRSRRRRGEDLVGQLALAAAGQLSGCRASEALGWQRRVAEQVGRSPGQRRRNLAGSMVARARPGAAAIVIDDVLTTGATLAEAVRALRAVGTPAVAGAVIAATDHRRSGERCPRIAG